MDLPLCPAVRKPARPRPGLLSGIDPLALGARHGLAGAKGLANQLHRSPAGGKSQPGRASDQIGKALAGPICLRAVDGQDDTVPVDDIDALQDAVKQGAQGVAALQDHLARRLDLLEQARVLDQRRHLRPGDLEQAAIPGVVGGRAGAGHAQHADLPAPKAKQRPQRRAYEHGPGSGGNACRQFDRLRHPGLPTLEQRLRPGPRGKRPAQERLLGLPKEAVDQGKSALGLLKIVQQDDLDQRRVKGLLHALEHRADRLCQIEALVGRASHLVQKSQLVDPLGQGVQSRILEHDHRLRGQGLEIGQVLVAKFRIHGPIGHPKADRLLAVRSDPVEGKDQIVGGLLAGADRRLHAVARAQARFRDQANKGLLAAAGQAPENALARFHPLAVQPPASEMQRLALDQPKTGRLEIKRRADQVENRPHQGLDIEDGRDLAGNGVDLAQLL